LRTAKRIVSRVLALVSILLVSGLAAAETRAETAVVRPEGPEAVVIDRALEILEDPSGEATLADVMGPLKDRFRPSATDRPSFGVSRGAA
jgi:hypothetical protein